jgi:hypothetical protein
MFSSKQLSMSLRLLKKLNFNDLEKPLCGVSQESKQLSINGKFNNAAVKNNLRISSG